MAYLQEQFVKKMWRGTFVAVPGSLFVVYDLIIHQVYRRRDILEWPYISGINVHQSVIHHIINVYLLTIAGNMNQLARLTSQLHNTVINEKFSWCVGVSHCEDECAVAGPRLEAH